ncbi:MAG TPA: AMP-binding protein [Solirubrobacterales bacterium]|nr:AMP-binding protein [Solirubrobacterales bacterium]
MAGERAVGLLDWMAAPRPDRGLHFAADGEGWDFWSYPRLTRAVAAQAGSIEAGRVRREGCVSIVGSGPAFVAAFVGALAAGNTPSPLAPPAFASDRDAYVAHAAAALRIARPTLILAEEAFLGALGAAAELAGLDQPPRPLVLSEADAEAVGPVADSPRALELPEAAPPPLGPAPNLALLQFTSGSTGRPRGVRVRRENLEANIAAIREWLEMGADDVTATWLPLHHDMGLIGCLLTPIVNQSDVRIIRPEQFVARPLRWLECFGRGGAALTAAPNFGFAYALRRVRDADLEGMDFSDWRAAIVGAERIDPATLGEFAARLGPHGFRASAFLPAYGLAEATLAVSGGRLGREPRAVLPDWSRAEPGEPLPLLAEAELLERERIGAGEGWLVGCGAPHAGVEVSILDGEGERLPDGHLGEIAVAGDSVADGYEGEAPDHATRFAGGRLHTGDLGAIVDGELLVAGRTGDALSVRGRMVFAEDLEARLVTVDGVRRGRCTVLCGGEAGGDRLVAVVEAAPGPWVEQAAALIRAEVGTEPTVIVLAGPPGTIERTSSGKPRRQVMWRALHDGRLAAEQLWPHRPKRKS